MDKNSIFAIFVGYKKEDDDLMRFSNHACLVMWSDPLYMV